MGEDSEQTVEPIHGRFFLLCTLGDLTGQKLENFGFIEIGVSVGLQFNAYKTKAIRAHCTWLKIHIS